MTALVERLRRPAAADPVRTISTIDEYVDLLNQFVYAGNHYPVTGINQSWGKTPTEKIAADLVGLASSAYAACGPVFSCMAVRQLVFSAVRFQWQRIRDGKPSDTFGNRDLELLERPWGIGSTTQDLLNRTIQHADLAGNAFAYADTPFSRMDGDSDGNAEIVTIRPDWVDVVMEKRMLRGAQLGWRKLGYLYTEGGLQSGNDPVPLLPDELSHFAPYPDPLANWRGMSWLTPVIREIQNDKLMARHQRKFFEHGGSPNFVVKLGEAVPEPAARRFATMMREQHGGVENAYKMMFLGGGADVTIVGSTFKDAEFVSLLSAAETRIAAAAGVPPVIAGFTKGLEEATYSNYGQARRRLADGTMHPLWQQCAGSFEPLVPQPTRRGRESQLAVRLWYDATGVPFLREDEKDAADIQSLRAQTLKAYLDAGYTAESSVLALVAGDERLLVHSGLFSVQLQPAGSAVNAAGGAGAGDNGGNPQVGSD